MKPAPFHYERPTCLAEALTMLDAAADEVKVLAGGQSLVPLMNFRLARPDTLIDINALPELSYLRRRDGHLHIGTLTRQTVLEQSALVQRHWPLLTEAVGLVAHPQIRNAGTVGGSIAHADPSAELPAALAALDASMLVQSASAQREMPWHAFFVDNLQTSLRPDELLLEIRVPPLPPRTGSSFTELTVRHGDFAIGGCGITVSLNMNDTCVAASISLLGAGPTPIRATKAEEALTGYRLETDLARHAAALAIEGTEPTDDLHTSSTYKRDAVESMVATSLISAAHRAQETR